MTEGGIPTRTRDFINRHISSVEQIELLILLAAIPEKRWTMPQLVKELRSSEGSISQRLRPLLEQGLVACDGESFFFAPTPPEKAVLCREALTVYQEYRVRVIELIYSQSGALKSFSDAFKFKPKD